MNCTTKLGATSQLRCIPLRDADNLNFFRVNFKSHLGVESTEMVCTRTGEWSCNKDLGFLVTHSKYHEITLPASYQGKSGNFTCETQSVESDAHPCQWPPPGAEFPMEATKSSNNPGNSEIFENSSELDNELSRNSSLTEGGSNDNNHKGNAAIIIACVCISVIIGIIIFMVVLKRRKSKKRKGFKPAGQNELVDSHYKAEEYETTDQPLLRNDPANPQVSNKDGETEFSTVQELAPIQRSLDERPKPRQSYEDPRNNINRRIPKRKTNPKSMVESEGIACIFPPRPCLKSVAWSTSSTGSCYIAYLTLTKEQSNLIQRDAPRLFLLGPPGTGKSVVLLWRCLKWLKLGHEVHIVSTGRWSRAACSMLYHLLLQMTKWKLNELIKPDKLYQHQYDFENKEEVKKALGDMSLKAKEGFLYVIADEVGPAESSDFKIFCEKLLSKVGGLHLWAATSFTKSIHNKWDKTRLTTPLRSPQVVIKEVVKQTLQTLIPYSEPLGIDKTDGPQIREINHRSHSERTIQNCIQCGQEIGSVLHDLHGVDSDNTASSSPSSNGTTLNRMQWREMLVLHSDTVEDEDGIVRGLKEHVPLRVMTDDDIDDVATAQTNVVWVANGDLVRGLERQVIVCLGVNDNTRLRCMSRCTSQLVTIIS